MKTFEIPKYLNLDGDSFEYLAELQNNILVNQYEEVVLDFYDCEYTNAAFTAFIGALMNICGSQNIQIKLRSKKGSKVNQYFKRSGLYNYLVEDEKKYINDNAIPFSKISLDDEFIIDYIYKILSLAPITLTSDCKQQLFRNIYEIFNNSVDHSEAQMGVFSCGHWMPNKKELVFSIYDTGKGIPKLIKSKVDKTFTSETALKWALVRGNSTKQLNGGAPRGLGLSDLIDFISLNNGSIQIMSNDILYENKKGKERTKKLQNSIIGTLISIKIVADYEHICISKREDR